MKNLKLKEKFKLLNNKSKLKTLIIPSLAIIALITTIYFSYAYYQIGCVGEGCGNVEIMK